MGPFPQGWEVLYCVASTRMARFPDLSAGRRGWVYVDRGN